MRYIQSEHISIANLEAKMDAANQLVENFIFDAGIKGKNALRVRLLSEEVLRLAKSIIGLGGMDFWIEGTSRVAYINLTSQVQVDQARKEELLSMSSSGENALEQGFFGKLVSLFTMDAPGGTSWSLKEYLDDLRHKKEDDLYSQEAWADLERSLVASLADDIEVGVSSNKVTMKVTKDLSEALATVGSRLPMQTTEYIFVDSDNLGDKLFDKADDSIASLELSKKDSIHLKLLFEEAVGMLKQMTTDYHALVYFTKYKEECCLNMTCKTEMDANKKSELLDISSNRENSAVKGFMSKVSDIIENGVLNYAEVMKLQQEYGGGYVNYGTMGMYGGLEGTADSGIMWSMFEYRGALEMAKESDESAKEAWDELERSIVASLVKDVLIGVKGNRVDVKMVYALNS